MGIAIIVNLIIVYFVIGLINRIAHSQANLALNKPAFQLGTDNGGDASRAVDGNKSSEWPTGSCIEAVGMNPWWAVDLQQKYFILGINLTSRSDCCVARVKSFIVGLTDNRPQVGISLTPNSNYTLCGQYPGNVSPGATAYQACAPGLLQYRFVIIQANSAITGENVTNICEVEVYGFACDVNCAVGCNNSGEGKCDGSCAYGYGITASNNCVDVDECASSNGNCSTNATCTNTVGSHNCSCKAGFSGNGFNCTDVDECVPNYGNCSRNATCTNTIGSYSCLCNAGFSGNGLHCTDINECIPNNGNCSTNATCTNTVGSYSCLCNAGFSGNGFNCTDVDECATNNVHDCSTNATCTNTIGSYNCACEAGFFGNGFICTESTTTSASPVTNGPGSTGAIIGGVVGGVLGAALAIGLVVLIAFLCRREKSIRGYRPNPQQKSEPAEKKKLPENVVLPLWVGTSVQLEDLAVHMEQMKATSGYETEFKELPKDDFTKCVVGKRPENKKKNRFINILPYDETRVKLFAREGDASEELYINGSIIRVDNYGREYIATQAPKAETVDDFWEMIWQQNVSCIVALVLVYEDGKKKCHEYWHKSVGGTSNSGRFTMKLIEVDTFPEFIRRKMSLQASGKPPRTLTQFQYLRWPDKGVPEHVWSLTAFRNRVRSFMPELSSGNRLLVHCSAGVGRTGTFIALDILLDVAAQTGSVDVFEVVMNIRLQRMSSVQTSVQYELLYSAVFDAYVTGNTAHQSSELKSLLTALQLNGSHKTLETEYQTLMQTRPALPHEEDVVALKPLNIKKNQTLSVIPISDSSRCQLSIGSDGTDYINASKAMGYKMQNTYILTQLPLSSTIGDFWKMVVTEKCSSIVSLQPLSLADPPFYPTKCGVAIDYGVTKVNLKSMKSVEAKKSTIALYTMTVTGKAAAERVELEVRLHELSSWNENLNTPHDVEEILELINLVNQWELGQQKTSKLDSASDRGRSVIVQCRDGATRSGLYAATSLAIDRLKCDNELDVFLSCRYITSVRPRTISSQAQYDFICRAAIESRTWNSSLSADDKLLQVSSGHKDHLYGNINPDGTRAKIEGHIYANKGNVGETSQSVPRRANQLGIYENIVC